MKDRRIEKCDKGFYVYKITNLMLNKAYIGRSLNWGIRKRDHFKNLREGTHHNKYLQQDWNEYGEESFNFEVLDTASDWDSLKLFEQDYIYKQEYKYNLQHRRRRY